MNQSDSERISSVIEKVGFTMTEIEEDQSEAGTVVQEIQSGYMLGERLLRTALVGIAKKKETKNEEKKEKKEEK